MVLIIGGIATAAISAYALWRRLHHGDLAAAHESATKIRVGADLLISIARTVSWVTRLMTGEVAGPVSTPGQRDAISTGPPGFVGGRTIPSRIGVRAGDLSEAEATAS